MNREYDHAALVESARSRRDGRPSTAPQVLCRRCELGRFVMLESMIVRCRPRVRRGERPPWIVSDELRQRIEPLCRWSLAGNAEAIWVVFVRLCGIVRRGDDR